MRIERRAIYNTENTDCRIVGTVGVTFAATASAAALVRRRNDYVSYGVGGGAAGLVFGFRSDQFSIYITTVRASLFFF